MGRVTAPPGPAGRPSLASRLAAAPGAVVGTLRRRWGWFEHLVHAGGRYNRVQGDLMAAGVTYFAFLSLFPVLLLLASIVGLVLSGNTVLQQQLYTAVREAIPGPTGDELVKQLQEAIGVAGVVGVVGLVGFLYAGMRAIDKLRIGMERLWKGRVEPADLLRDNVQDVLALLALGAAGLISLGLTGVLTRATTLVLDVLRLDGAPGYGVLTWFLGIALAAVGDVLVFLWLLRVVPATSLGLRRLLPGALFGAAGVELLKLIGSFYLSLISGSVTASAFGGAVGTLVWINLVARFAFYVAAWTATQRAVEPLFPEIRLLPDEPSAAASDPAASDPAAPPAVSAPRRSRPPAPALVAAVLLSAGAVLGTAATGLVRRRRR
jgi:membrane protein